MDPYALGTLRFFHILFTATWFGAGLAYAGDIRRTLEKGAPHTDLLAARMSRVFATMTGSAFMTLVTGFVLIFALGGFAQVPPRIHAGLTLSLVLFGLLVAVIRPAWGRIAELLATPSGLDEARKLAPRMAMFAGISHLLWVIVLVVMVIPIGG